MTNPQCQNCNQKFERTTGDFEFYKKLAVPPTTWCPECRQQRRLSFRNERNFYGRKCDLCHKDIISMYEAKTPYPVYCQDCWWSDKWDPTNYGQQYDFSRSFFDQNRELRLKVPRLALINKNSVNCGYTNLAANNKNCYMLIESSNNEDCYHSYWLENFCKDVFDSGFLTKVETAYESTFCWNSYKMAFSKNCRDCFESAFLLDCVNVNNSFCCVNLRNKQHCIFNVQYTPEEYKKKLAEYDLGSYKGLHQVADEFAKFVAKFPRRFAYTKKAQDCSGDYIVNSKNCHDSYYVEDAENVSYSTHVFERVKDCADVDTLGLGGELCYESINTALKVYDMRFCMVCWAGNSCEYCDHCFDGSSCFGCIGLRNKSYCILNKQYSKDEYVAMVAKIKEQMQALPYKDKNGRVYGYGEYFPPELSPFPYNATAAREYWQLSADKAQNQGFNWKESERPIHKSTLAAADLPDHIKDTPDSITSEIIECEHQGKCPGGCTTAFKVLPQELAFYKKYGLALPRLCPNCRHFLRIKFKNPLKLWHRQCMCDYQVYNNASTHNHHKNGRCNNEFESTFAPAQENDCDPLPAIVYCQECYQSEII